MQIISYTQFLKEGYRDLAAANEYRDESDKHEQNSLSFHKYRALHHLNMVKHHTQLSNIHMEQGSTDGAIKHKNIANAHDKRYLHHKNSFVNFGATLAGNI